MVFSGEGACMVFSGEGACVVFSGGVVFSGDHAWLRDTVNERAVRILLECILVV